MHRLANHVYDMVLHQEPDYRIWAYRKAAWAIDDLEQDIGLVYQAMRLKGLQNIQNIGLSLEKAVETMLVEEKNQAVG